MNTLPQKSPSLRRGADRAFQVFCILAASSAVLLLIVLVASIAMKGWKHLSFGFLTRIASPDPAACGVLPPLVGSVIVCGLCMLAAVPLGVGTAVLLEEFKPKNRLLARLHGLIEVNITNLAGVPSIVYGILGVTVFATAFGLFDGPDAAPPAIGIQWFDQYALPDQSTVFVKAKGALPKTPEGQAQAALDETAAFLAASKRAPEQARAALPLYAQAMATLAGMPKTAAAVETAGLPEAVQAKVAPLTTALVRADQAGETPDPAKVAPRVAQIADARRALLLHCVPLETKAAMAETPEEREKLAQAALGARAVLAALQDDTKAALLQSLGAHPLRAFIVPTESTRWLGGDIMYQVARSAEVPFEDPAHDAANDAAKARGEALGDAIRAALDEARTGERKTGPVKMPADAAAGLAKQLLADHGAATAKDEAFLAARLAALDGTEGSALRRGRSALLEDLERQLAGAKADAAPKLAIGTQPLRVSRTLWYHVSLPLGRGVLAGALTLMLVVLPVVIVASQEALRAVPQTLRQAAMGLGATRLETVTGAVLPASIPGICTGVILALSRAIGEAAPILILGGVVYITFLPGNLMDGFTVMPLQIFAWASEPDHAFHELAAAGILILLAVLAVFNGIAVFIRQKTSAK